MKEIFVAYGFITSLDHDKLKQIIDDKYSFVTHCKLEYIINDFNSENNSNICYECGYSNNGTTLNPIFIYIERTKKTLFCHRYCDNYGFGDVMPKDREIYIDPSEIEIQQVKKIHEILNNETIFYENITHQLFCHSST